MICPHCGGEVLLVLTPDGMVICGMCRECHRLVTVTQEDVDRMREK
jgi:uncharacterized Zn finger protein (UPF0148 family)